MLDFRPALWYAMHIMYNCCGIRSAHEDEMVGRNGMANNFRVSNIEQRKNKTAMKKGAIPHVARDVAYQTAPILRETGPAKFNFYYSSAVEGDLGNLLGSPHYSYRFAEAKFVSMLTSYKVNAHKLKMPEYYNTAAAIPKSMRLDDASDLHLIFRSAEQIRLLKFAWNIACFAWEFDVIKDETQIDEHPFLNQKRMLALCNEIWVPCSYTKSVLERYGLTNVHVIPAPITIGPKRPSVRAALSHLADVVVAPLHFNFLRSQSQNRAACRRGLSTLGEWIGRSIEQFDVPRVYLTILNPEDFRKNLDALLRAFYHFSNQHRESILMVKVLTSAARFDLLDVLSDVVPKKMASGTVFGSENIVFFNDFLSESQMRHLFALADFYLSASLCEGQNLPLLEAMTHGIVPVTTANTAMADYIDANNAVIIKDHLVLNDCVHLAGTIAGRPFSIRRSEVGDIHDGLQRSAMLTPARYTAMAARGKRMIRERYAPDAVWSNIRARLATIPKCGS